MVVEQLYHARHGKRKRDFGGRFLFLLYISFLNFGAAFNKTISPLWHVTDEIAIAN